MPRPTLNQLRPAVSRGLHDPGGILRPGGVNAPADFEEPDHLVLDKNGNFYIIEDPGGTFSERFHHPLTNPGPAVNLGLRDH